MTISRDDMDAIIRRNFAETYASQHPGATPPDLSEDQILLESGLDSLGFAILVTRLEDELGFDPFILSETAVYPRSYGEFLSFYSDNQPA